MKNRTKLATLAVLGSLVLIVAAQPVFAHEFEGCTPGYWKQEHHFDSWVSMPTNYSLKLIFERACGTSEGVPDITALQALWLKGGHENAFFRHAVAAILNFQHPDVSHGTWAGVQADVCAPWWDGLDWGDAKDELEYYNEMFCPLD